MRKYPWAEIVPERLLTRLVSVPDKFDVLLESLQLFITTAKSVGLYSSINSSLAVLPATCISEITTLGEAERTCDGDDT